MKGVETKYARNYGGWHVALGNKDRFVSMFITAPDMDIPNHHIQSQTEPDMYLHIETHTFAPDPLLRQSQTRWLVCVKAKN